MIDWRSLEVEIACAEAYSKFTDVAAGVYIWYFLTTLHHVEIPLLTKALKVAPALIPYILGRYSVLISNIILPLASRGTLLPDCRLLKIIIVFLAGPIVCLSSTAILLRPLVLWRGNVWAFALLMSLSFIQWGLSITVIVELNLPEWSDRIPSCGGVAIDAAKPNPVIITFYLFTILFDLLILVATVWGLHRQEGAKGSLLWSLVYRQGALYVAVAVTANLPTLTLIWLNLNGPMSLFFVGPGGSASVMASSTAFTSLLRLKERGPSSEDIELQETDASTTLRNEAKDAGNAHNQFTTHISLGMATASSSHLSNDPQASSSHQRSTLSIS